MSSSCLSQHSPLRMLSNATRCALASGIVGLCSLCPASYTHIDPLSALQSTAGAPWSPVSFAHVAFYASPAAKKEQRSSAYDRRHALSRPPRQYSAASAQFKGISHPDRRIFLVGMTDRASLRYQPCRPHDCCVLLPMTPLHQVLDNLHALDRNRAGA